MSEQNVASDRPLAPEVEWAICQCGKEFEVYGDELRRRLGKMSLCRSCDADFARDQDLCPESVRIPNGISGCSLGWKHVGRCEPYGLTAEWPTAHSDDTTGPADA